MIRAGSGLGTKGGYRVIDAQSRVQSTGSRSQDTRHRIQDKGSGRNTAHMQNTEATISTKRGIIPRINWLLGDTSWWPGKLCLSALGTTDSSPDIFVLIKLC